MKLSNTNQRRVIMEELRKLKCHPTADELYGIVKQRLPKISLATVYRNLGLLADAGEIRRIELAEPLRRRHIHSLSSALPEMRSGRGSANGKSPVPQPRLDKGAHRTRLQCQGGVRRLLCRLLPGTAQQLNRCGFPPGRKNKKHKTEGDEK